MSALSATIINIVLCFVCVFGGAAAETLNQEGNYWPLMLIISGIAHFFTGAFISINGPDPNEKIGNIAILWTVPVIGFALGSIYCILRASAFIVLWILGKLFPRSTKTLESIVANSGSMLSIIFGAILGGFALAGRTSLDKIDGVAYSVLAPLADTLNSQAKNLKDDQEVKIDG